MAGLALKAGDVIRLETAGGGGFGNHVHRDEALTCHDLEQGYIDIGLDNLSEAYTTFASFSYYNFRHSVFVCCKS